MNLLIPVQYMHDMKKKKLMAVSTTTGIMSAMSLGFISCTFGTFV
ncbi:hypothetical protein BD31_I0723 [Candidatus Nitrosopumilus salaria BD31]|uniref:Uncharacterized protein n=1 Tax=Candidatus Nitrosopumilus salarius BD31 TaxID=859350 RepID=I3D183_9ARCH|nr:hypothetical protein BD31_I0723 [Candidatus Nitrosopumilus salaria BD31]